VNNHSPFPPEPPVQRSGCLTGFLVLAGLTMLLPGVCVFGMLGGPGRLNPLAFLIILLTIGGIALIVYALRRD
jgi:hypothetical protein